MKRTLVILGLLLALGTGASQAQVGVSLSFGDPYLNGYVQIGRPYYHRHYYSRPYYPRYRPVRVIIVEPRYYRVRHYRGHRYHRGW